MPATYDAGPHNFEFAMARRSQWRGGTSDRFGRGLPELVRFLGQLEGGEADRRSRGGDSSTKAEVARIMWAAVQLPAEEAAGGDARG